MNILFWICVCFIAIVIGGGLVAMWQLGLTVKFLLASIVFGSILTMLLKVMK